MNAQVVRGMGESSPIALTQPLSAVNARTTGSTRALVRPATEKDIPRIVALLKVALGDGSTEKSEALWRWKHVDNPFGVSPVLVAEGDDELIGVRAFMPWSWHLGGRTVSAVRAVDTATHPRHQGRGIFRQLTMQLVDDCAARYVGFIFNTPNRQSGPGYLKMGWSSLGRLPMCVRPVMGRRLASESTPPRESLETALSHDAIDRLLASWAVDRDGMTTSVTRRYLRWRYLDYPSPTAEYAAVGNLEAHRPYLAILRTKARLGFTEVRIVDFFALRGFDRRECRARVARAVGVAGPVVMTWAPQGRTPWPYQGLSGRMGPLVTVRPSNEGAPDGPRAFAWWQPSLGDMELF